MAERLPNINEGSWQNIMGANDGSGGFLRVTHNDDGTLRPQLQVLATTALSADQNDWAPAGISTAGLIEVSSNATRTITGMTAAGVAGRGVIMLNSGVNTVQLTHEDSASVAANRFFIGNNSGAGAIFSLWAGSQIWLVYDGSRWRVVGNQNPGGATPAAPTGAGTVGTSPFPSHQDHAHPANDMAVDTIWNAAGDIAYATGADAATVLSIGTAFRTIRSTSGATAPEWVGGAGMVGDSGVLAVSATTIDFSSISGSYAHLVALVYARGTEAVVNSYWAVRVNNVTTATYDRETVFGFAAGAGAVASTSGTSTPIGPVPGASATASLFGSGALFIPNYTGTTGRKSWWGVSGGMDTEGASTNWEIDLTTGKNRANTAITQVTFGIGTFGTHAFAAGSRITLYGLGV